MKYSLVGVDGNAFAIIGYVCSAMKKEGLDPARITDYKKDAMSDDYTHLLVVSMDVIDELNDKRQDDFNDDDEDDEGEDV